MLIKVLYENNTYGMIKSSRLEEFIVSGSITKFFRSSGWVNINTDPIRKTKCSSSREMLEIATYQSCDKLEKCVFICTCGDSTSDQQQKICRQH